MENDNNEPISCLRHEVIHNEKMEKEREANDERYATKLTQQIVFGMVGLILIAVVTAIVALVVR